MGFLMINPVFKFCFSSLLIASAVFGQVADSALTFIQHDRGFYQSPDGRLYISQMLPVYLQISTSAEASDSRLLKPNGIHALPMKLTEGKNILQNLQGALAAPDGSELPAVFEVWADGTPPDIRMQFIKAARFETDQAVFYGPHLQIDLTREDALSGVKETCLSVNGQPFMPFDSSQMDFTQDGAFILKTYAVDQVGNVSSIHEESFTVDVSPPITKLDIVGPRNEDILSPEAELLLSAEDSLSGVQEIFHAFDDADPADYHGALSLRDLEDGNHQIRFWAVDQVLNSESKQTYPFYLDKAPPELSFEILGPEYGHEKTIYVSGSSSIQLTGQDNRAGVADIQIRMDGGEAQPYRSPISVNDKSGLRRISYFAFDSVGNKTEVLKTKVYVDLTPPETVHELKGSVLSLGDTLLINAQTQIVLSSMDLESGVKEIRFSVNGGSEYLYQDAIKLQDNGDYIIQYTSVDRVGNLEENHTLLLRVDNSPRRPVAEVAHSDHLKVWLAQGTENPTGSTGLPFYLRIATGPEASAQSFLIDPAAVQTDDPKPLAFDQEGLNQLVMRLAGKEKTFDVPIDGAPPKTEIRFKGAKSYNRDGMDFYGSGLVVLLESNDPSNSVQSGLDKIYFSIDGSAFGIYRDPLTVFTREREYHLRYYAVDQVGNAETLQETRFSIDTAPPRTRLEVGGTFYGNMLSENSIITLTASDHLSGVEKIYYFIDETSRKIYKHPLTQADISGLEPGEHTITYNAVDGIGNTEEPKSFMFYFDPDPPTVTLLIQGDQYKSRGQTYVSSRTKFALSAEDVANEVKSVHYQLDDSRAKLYHEPFALQGRERPYKLIFYAGDQVDNLSEKQTRTLTLDRTPPETVCRFEGPVFADANQTYIGPDTRVVLSAEDAISGVKTIQVRLDQQSWMNYQGELSIRKLGPHRISFFARDRVNNEEKRQSIQFFLDNRAPSIHVTTSVSAQSTDQRNVFVIPAGASIYISAEDEHTGIEKITYSINGGDERLYRTPITGFKPGDRIPLIVRAADRVGNVEEKRLTYRIGSDE